MNEQKSILLFSAIGIILFSSLYWFFLRTPATPEEGNSNSAKMSVPANQTNNLIFGEKSNMNTEKNIMTTEPPEISEAGFSDSLKQTLLKTSETDHITDAEWSSGDWKKKTIGGFFRSKRELIERAVVDAATNVLEPNNRRMLDRSRRDLIKNVTAEKTCSFAVEQMRKAASDSTWIVAPQ